MKCVIDCLNVGFGEATVIRLEGGERSLCYVVDAGDAAPPYPNPRRISLAGYIQEFGIERIDGLVLTHFHKDHIGGALAVIRSVPVGEIIAHIPLPEQVLAAGLHDHATPIRSSITLYAELIREARQRQLPLRFIEEPVTIGGGQGLELALLTPDRDRWQLLRAELEKLDVARLDAEEQRLSLIDRSLNRVAMAVLVRYSGSSLALLTSDVGADFWEPYAAELGHVHLLQAAHHGDSRAVTPEMLRSWSPRVVVVSADDQGTYGMPHPDYEAVIHGHSAAELHYTEGSGTVHRIIRLEVETEAEADAAADLQAQPNAAAEPQLKFIP